MTAGNGGVQVIRNLVYNYTILFPPIMAVSTTSTRRFAAADQQQITLAKNGSATSGN
jgi:hypothetical protein